MVTDLAHLDFIPYIPTALSVPNNVAITDESTARIRVFLRASMVELSFKSSAYHLKENPPKTEVLLAELKEKTIITAIGAYKNISTKAV
jgi:hypothetical protein